MNAIVPGVVFAAVPLAFNRENALRYTGIAERLFNQLEKAGSLTGRKVGKNGEVMYSREQLERVAASLYGAGAIDLDEEFGIGG